MNKKLLRQRPVLNPAQILVLILVILSLIIALDLNRRERDGQAASGAGAAALQTELDREATRQVELLATREFVQSDEYVESYARDEAGLVQPGEQRVAPLIVQSTPLPTAAPAPTPDPASIAQPWQAWWQLLTDAPPPVR